MRIEEIQRGSGSDGDSTQHYRRFESCLLHETAFGHKKKRDMYTLLGTHNSATGEKPADLVSRLGAPIAKCQNRTISQQLEAGVRLFDLRVKPYRRRSGLYFPLEHIEDCTLGHGMCDYSITLRDALRLICDFGKENGREMYVLVTLEDDACGLEEKFAVDVIKLVAPMPYVTLLEVNVKRPEWTQLWRNHSSEVTYRKDYPLIGGLRMLLPFPWIWNKFIDYRPQVDAQVYSLRDFV